MDIKEKIQQSRVRQWEIAERIGMTEFHLSRILRRPERLETKMISKIEQAINDILNKE